MTVVRIIKDWQWPDIMRQTPTNDGLWDDIQFTEEPLETCDYVIVCNRTPYDATVRCMKQAVWAVIQEPPVPEYRWLEKGFSQFGRIFTPDTNFKGEQFTYSHGALPWHVNRNYDFLKNCPPPPKDRALSWITSNALGRVGHRQRMEFLAHLQQQVQFDLWGRGFQSIDDKWDGLAAYHYALAIENHSGPYYWTEKLADCFLSWTMPIYYGCTNIYDYFPKESILWVDITQPQEALNIIKEAIQSNLSIRNREAIAEARRLILDRYQFFPFFASAIREFEQGKETYQPQRIKLHALPFLYHQPDAPLKSRGVLQKIINLKDKLKNIWK